MRVPRSRLVRATTTVAALALTLGLTACDSGATPSPASPTTGSASNAVQKTALSFGVYGPHREVAALQKVVDSFNAESDASRVTLRSWDDHDAMMADLRPDRPGAEPHLPDVFMVSRGDLAWLRDSDLNQPVDQLLDARGVDFGDGYSRDALEAFSADNRLQCMPYGLSPMVMYLNTDLVDFAAMQDRDLDAPDPEGEHSRWSFEQFAAAARFATHERRGTRGVYIEPTLEGLSPFIYSGGGSVYNDDEPPTSLAFSDDSTRDALERTLELLRNPHVTLSEKQVEKAPALHWFEKGKLGMVAGYRSLVPELRKVEGLHFDVMPMPVLDGSATTGDITGMCLASGAASSPEAADFLAYVLSTDAAKTVAKTGYLAPANLEAAASDAFLQPTKMPAHAAVFNSTVRYLQLPPVLEERQRTHLRAAITGSLHDLLTVPVLDLEQATEVIDRESQSVLTPPEPPESPSESSSASSSVSTSGARAADGQSGDASGDAS